MSAIDPTVKLTRSQGGLSFNNQILTQTAGLYVISIQNPGKSAIAYKVGMSNNLIHRMRGYHTCFMDGYNIYGIMLLVNYDGGFSKLSDTNKGKISSAIRQVEKTAHQLLKKHQVGKASTTSEWFKVDNVSVIDTALRKAYNQHKNLFGNQRLKSNALTAPTYIDDVTDRKYDKLPRKKPVRRTKEEFEPLKIVTHDFSRKKIKVRWKGYKAKDDTWEDMSKWKDMRVWKTYKKKNNII